LQEKCSQFVRYVDVQVYALLASGQFLTVPARLNDHLKFMSSAVILEHASHVGPGRIVPIFRDFGIPCDIRHLHKGDEVPTDLDEIRVLIVLGGPMGIADIGNSNFPFLEKELETIKRLVQLDRPLLGIGLGAQLLAQAAGAKVYPNVKMAPPAGPGQPPKPVEPIEPMPEFGWNPVNFPFPGGTEPIVFGCSDGAPFFHWHFDTFDLPRLPPPANPAPPPAPPPPTGNALIATTRTCRNQAFRFKNRLFGFQFHFEQTDSGIAQIAEVERKSFEQVLGAGAVAKIAEQTKQFYPRYARLGDRILQNFVQFLKAY
jgi:GMP synthase (glutamine-hydrolysing)